MKPLKLSILVLASAILLCNINQAIAMEEDGTTVLTSLKEKLKHLKIIKGNLVKSSENLSIDNIGKSLDKASYATFTDLIADYSDIIYESVDKGNLKTTLLGAANKEIDDLNIKIYNMDPNEAAIFPKKSSTGSVSSEITKKSNSTVVVGDGDPKEDSNSPVVVGDGDPKEDSNSPVVVGD